MRILLTILWAIILMNSIEAQNIVPIKENGLWGLYDLSKSQVILEPEYEFISGNSRIGYSIKLNKLYGRVSSTGDIEVPPQFKKVHTMRNWCYSVTLPNDQLNVYSLEKKQTLLPENDYDQIVPIAQHYFGAFIKGNDDCIIFDKDGNKTYTSHSLSLNIKKAYGDFCPFKDETGMCGLLDLSNGKTITPPTLRSITPITEKISSFSDDSIGKGLMNHIENRIILPSDYIVFQKKHSDYLIAKGYNNNPQIFHIKSEEYYQLPDNYDDYIFYKNGIEVHKNDNEGFIDYKGNVLIPVAYENLINVNNNKHFKICIKNGLYGIYDIRNNKEIFPPRFKNIKELENNFFLTTSINGGQGVISPNFKKIIPTQYEKITIKDNTIKARLKKTVEVFWLDDNYNIKEQENYDEYYTLRIGFQHSAIVKNQASTEIPPIEFPNTLYEWTREGEELFAYRKKGKRTVESDFVYDPYIHTNTHFSFVKVDSIRNSRNPLIRKLSTEIYSFQPQFLFDGNKGVFLHEQEGFLGFRLRDMLTSNLPFFTVIRADGSFGLMKPDGSWILDKKGEPFSATYIDKFRGNHMRFAIGGEWESEKDSIKHLPEEFIIPSNQIYNDFNIKSHYEKKYWISKAALKNAKWGYINNKGEVIVEPQFDNASVVQLNRAVVQKNGKVGAIDMNNELLIPFEYDKITIRQDSLIQLFKKNTSNETYLLNNNGRQLLQDKYLKTRSLKENKRIAIQNKKYGVLDSLGYEIIPCEYDSIGDFDGTYALAIKDGQSFLINEQGKHFLESSEYEIMGPEKDGFIRVRKNDKYGFIDINGKVVIPLKFMLAFDFDQGLARVVAARKTGLINKDGTFVLVPKNYELVFPFNEHGLAVVQYVQFGAKGLIDRNGEEILKPHYDEIYPFYDGVAIVKKDGFYGYINLQGEEVIPTELNDAYRASEGIIAIKKKKYSLWTFRSISNEKINDLKFTAPAMYKDGYSIITIVTDTQSYHRCLVNLEGDTLFFSDKENMVYFYQDGLVGIRNKKTMSGGRVKTTYTYMELKSGLSIGRNNGYRKLLPFNNGVTVAQSTTSMGLMNEQSDYITSRKYKNIIRNQDNDYEAIPEQFYGLAQYDGKIVLPIEYDYIERIYLRDREIFQVEKGDKIGYFDKKTLVWVWDVQ